MKTINAHIDIYTDTERREALVSEVSKYALKKDISLNESIAVIDMAKRLFDGVTSASTALTMAKKAIDYYAAYRAINKIIDDIKTLSKWQAL